MSDRTFTAALRELASKQKTAKGAPAYSRFVNRKLGRVLAAAAYVAGMTPNQVTAVSAACTYGGIALIALVRPGPLLAVGVCLALVTGYALDSADGQLARLRGGGSKAGEWLDHVVDAIKISSLHAAVLVSFYRFFDLGHAGYLLIPVAFEVVAAVMFFGMILNDLLRRVHRAMGGRPDGGLSSQANGRATAPANAQAPADPARPSTVRSLLVVPTDYGLLCLAFLLLGFERIFLVAYAVLFAGNLLFLIAALAKWYRDIAALDRTAAPEPVLERSGA